MCYQRETVLERYYQRVPQPKFYSPVPKRRRLDARFMPTPKVYLPPTQQKRRRQWSRREIEAEIAVMEQELMSELEHYFDW